jgi:hypothetical protein
MSLKLYGIRSCVRDSIYERVSLAKATVVRLRDLADDQTFAWPFAGGVCPETDLPKIPRHSR